MDGGAVLDADDDGVSRSEARRQGQQRRRGAHDDVRGRPGECLVQSEFDQQRDVGLPGGLDDLRGPSVESRHVVEREVGHGIAQRRRLPAAIDEVPDRHPSGVGEERCGPVPHEAQDLDLVPIGQLLRQLEGRQFGAAHVVGQHDEEGDPGRRPFVAVMPSRPRGTAPGRVVVPRTSAPPAASNGR